MISYRKIEFDDHTEELNEETGDIRVWSQVCKKHAKQFKFREIDESPSDTAICGVYKCRNKAFYYLDFIDQRLIRI